MSCLQDFFAEALLNEKQSQEKTIKNSLIILLMHMLKCKYQNDYPDKSSWRKSIIYSVDNITQEFKERHGEYTGAMYKKYYLRDVSLDKCYKMAVRKASEETRLKVSVFPSECEWTKRELIDQDYIFEFIDKYGQDNN